MNSDERIKSFLHPDLLKMDQITISKAINNKPVRGLEVDDTPFPV